MTNKVFKLFKTDPPDNTNPEYLRGRQEAFDHVATLLKEFKWGIGSLELPAFIKMVRNLK